ncbi:unnamed protein product [Cyprideis torosa]|uniref:Uncharacterized protein n=1 Tax=Cyprideis torosa TaxID=163714 RepID=A0A7R8W1P1_9CRUS|nr:unnamed protein product [Cyprideis torosa]CAG0881144.1 unnamed protein product [Cyprideis torosa]
MSTSSSEYTDRDSIMDWRKEANGVITDVKDCVGEIFVAESLPNSKSRIFLNLTVLEGRKYTLELNVGGFRVVGEAHDILNEELSNEYHETPYSLLAKLSKRYNEVFYEKLSRRLAEEGSNESDDSPSGNKEPEPMEVDANCRQK